jgi:glucose 1-dehydrogenase
MKAINVEPRKPGSVRFEEVPEPDARDGSVLVQAVAVGVCGTDAEIVAGAFGASPPGKTRLVLGHESLGRVLDPGPASSLSAGDLVAGIVRRPDPVPCPNCAVGEWDMCRNLLYTERGIQQIDGFMSERWRIEPEYALRIDGSLGLLGVLLEPLAVVVKAWEHVLAIGQRARFEPRSVLVTGAGPIGMLAAMLGKQRGLDVHVLDRVEKGIKPELVEALGATYHTSDAETIEQLAPPDIVVEATGVPKLVFDVMQHNASAGVVCLTGVSPIGRDISIDAGQLGRDIVLENDVIFGSVNANLGHYELAARALASAERGWLERMITRRVPLEHFDEALDSRPDDVKVVLDLQA